MSTIKRPLVTDFKQISAAKIEIFMKGTQIIKVHDWEKMYKVYLIVRYL